MCNLYVHTFVRVFVCVCMKVIKTYMYRYIKIMLVPSKVIYIIFAYTFCRGDSTSVQKGPLVGSAWLDNKIVTVLSTTNQPEDESTVLRCQKDGSQVPVNCPQNIADYNKYMGGVNRGDQLHGYYRCCIISRRFRNTYFNCSWMWP